MVEKILPDILSNLKKAEVFMSLPLFHPGKSIFHVILFPFLQLSPSSISYFQIEPVEFACWEHI